MGADKKTSLPVLDLGAAIERSVPDTFVWNTVAKKVTYIPISSTGNMLLALARPVYIGDDYHYVVDHKTNTVSRINSKGEIVCSFSRRGQGPGEYIYLTYVHIDPENRTVCVYDQKRNNSIIYDLDGNFIQEIPFAEKKINTPLLVSSDYAVVKGEYSESDCKLYITDKEFNKEKGLFPLDTSLTDGERLCLTWQLNFCRNRDRAIVHYTDEDTVFSVTKEGVLPICIVEKGQYKLPKESAKKPQEITPEGSPYIQTMGLSLISDYYMVSYVLRNKLYNEIWNKVDNRIITRFSSEEGKRGIPFRLPNGNKTWIDTRSLYMDGKTIAFSINAYTAFEGGVPGVGEDDNPVLVIMDL